MITKRYLLSFGTGSGAVFEPPSLHATRLKLQGLGREEDGWEMLQPRDLDKRRAWWRKWLRLK